VVSQAVWRIVRSELSGIEMDVQVFLINLDSDTERRSAMDAELYRSGIAYERFPAISGGTLPDWIKDYLSDDGKLTSGEIGCYASHLALMRRAVETGRATLVFEDDLRIAPGFRDLLERCLRSPHSWDILRLSKTDRPPTTRLDDVGSGYNLVRYFQVPLGTGAYLITPAGARKFLNWPQKRWRPVDRDLRRVWETNLLTLGVSPDPVTQNVAPSTIDATGRRLSKKQKYAKDSRHRDRLSQFIYNCRTIGIWPTLVRSY
jgi:glycosyl transferase family 25